MILVGPPAGLSTSKRPSSARIRRSSPASPLPDGSAPPCPSSEITMFIVWSSWVRTTRMSRALRVLGGVGDRLARDEVEGGLHLRHRTLVEAVVDGDRHARAFGHPGQRGPQPELVQRGRIDPPATLRSSSSNWRDSA